MSSPQGSQPFLLLGGIGSGKSYVAAQLSARGVAHISADEVGHSVLEPDGPAFRQVAERFPQAVIDGRISRQVLGSIVFADGDALADLEALTHPAIGREIRRRAAAVAGFVAVEMPLARNIVGDGWPRVVVDAPIDIRRARLRKRGMSIDDINARLAAQPTRDEWLALADRVIDNRDGADLAGQLDDLIEWLGDFVPPRR